MNDNLDKILNAEAERFIDDMGSHAMLAYHLYQTVMNTESFDDIHDDLDQLFQDQDYNTDATHFLPKLSDRLDNSLDLWAGYYRLSDGEQSINLVIGAKTDAKSAAQTKAYINGVSLKNYTFKDAVLDWDDTEKEGGTKGRLVFVSYFDQKNTGEKDTDYFGPYCEGSINMDSDSAAIQVKGKVGVYSLEAITGDYTVTDPLPYWAGKYAIYSAGSQEADTLEINASDEGGKVLFNDEEIKQFEYTAGSLRWNAKKGGHRINHSVARLTFIENASGKKLISGNIRKIGQAAEGVDCNGMQTSLTENGSDDLLITTTDLGILSNTKTVLTKLEASGGKTPYSWKVKGLLDNWGGVSNQDALPTGLSFDSNGTLMGKPEKEGIYPIDVMVTDSSTPTNTNVKRFYINVTNDEKSKSAEEQAKSWLASPPVSAILGIISGFLIYFFKGKYDEYKEKKKLETAKEAAESQLPDLEDIGKADSAEKREEIINRLKEYRRKAVAKIREQVKSVNEALDKRLSEVIDRKAKLEAEKDKPGLDPETVAELEQAISEAAGEMSEILKEKSNAREQIPPEEDEGGEDEGGEDGGGEGPGAEV